MGMDRVGGKWLAIPGIGARGVFWGIGVRLAMGRGKTRVPSVFSSFLPSWGLISPPLTFLNVDLGVWLFSYFNLDLLKYLPEHGELWNSPGIH